jgi:oligopeptide/dipeptide ABC transporter ATP-binding protein
MSTPILAVTDLKKDFVARRDLFGRVTARVQAVDGVSFALAEGETLALVGESGCGKSTVGRLVLNLIPPTSGQVLFQGLNTQSLDAAQTRRLRSRAQLIFQDPYASLNPRMTIGETLAEPLMLHTDLTIADRRVRVGELMATVGLRPQHASRYPHEFSGGQRQRIAIARALAPGPKLIVCDEPVSALDVSIRAQILNLLADLQQRLGLAYIFISHDLAVVKHIAARVAVMYLGRIVETAPTAELFRHPHHPYTQALLSAIPVPSPVGRGPRRLLAGDPPSPITPPAGCHLHPRCPHAADVCRTAVPALVAEGAHATACHRIDAIGTTGFTPPTEADMSPSLKRLLAAYTEPT